MKLLVGAKKWSLNERKRQQQEDESKKRSFSSGAEVTPKFSVRDKDDSIVPKKIQKLKIL
jgi:hypothetical protein